MYPPHWWPFSRVLELHDEPGSVLLLFTLWPQTNSRLPSINQEGGIRQRVPAREAHVCCCRQRKRAVNFKNEEQQDPEALQINLELKKKTEKKFCEDWITA